ncbi:sugar kinase [Nocardioides acrostichi]|uniref:Sugar kinase n=1 Tax=Nocardioides acrostichi TaxID=2784339 RepID=A0A930Y7F7_9ACTN|nr:sugar kinase [Nocardioides acrostichi]MBF4163370.1 sugar kinase [Nocardioides acrostichi]
MSRVVCIGEGLLVLRGYDDSSLEHATLLARCVGGAECNVALALADLGLDVSWLSRVGEDSFGRLLLTQMRRGGVDVSAVVRDPERPTGLYFKDRVEGRSSMRYHRAGSAATALDAALIESSPALGGVDLVHVSGITVGVVEDPSAVVDALLRRRDAEGWELSVDLNWRPVLWGSRDPEPLLRLLRGADLVLAGADEAGVAFGAEDADAVVDMLGGRPTVVLKDDAHRACVRRPGGGHVEVPALTVQVVETIGAGDGFAAGFLAARLSGEPDAVCLRMGHLQAALTLATEADQASAAAAPLRALLRGATEEVWAGTRVGPDGVEVPEGARA